MRKVQGIGINDIKGTTVTGKKFYAKWMDILTAVVGKRKAATQEYTVDDSWLTLSIFKKWFDAQPQKDNPEFFMDAVWLNCSGHRHFSPETTVYVPALLLHFFKQKPRTASNLMLGICKTLSGKYATTQCRDFTPQSSTVSFPSFDSDIDAHVHYLSRKMEVLNYVRKNYELDERLFIVMDLVQDKLQYHIDNRIELKKLYDLFN